MRRARALLAGLLGVFSVLALSGGARALPDEPSWARRPAVTSEDRASALPAHWPSLEPVAGRLRISAAGEDGAPGGKEDLRVGRSWSGAGSGSFVLLVSVLGLAAGGSRRRGAAKAQATSVRHERGPADEEVFRIISESAQDAVIMMDGEERVSFWNPAAERIFGWSREEAVGKTLHEMLAPKRFRGAHREAFARFLATGEGGAVGKTLELAALRRDGQEIPIELFLVAVRRNDEWHAVGVVRDISERKRAEEQLRQSEEPFRTILNAVPMGIALIDRQTREILKINQVVAEMIGAAKEEIRGRACHELLCRVGPGACLLGDGTRRVGGVEGVLLRKDGDETPVLRTAAPITLSGHDYLLESFVDITEQTEMREALQDAKHQAEAAASAKARFLANMSHEIRTPINAVMGMNGLLLDTELTSEQRQYATAVESSARALLAIINDILDFSKVEAGKLDLEMLDFDLRMTLEEMLDILAVKPQEKGLELTCMVDEEVPSALRGDPWRLRQVLTNLVGNAVKFTEAGEISLRVSLSEEDASRATLRFEVRDTGIGIAPERVGALFDAFSQADASMSRRYGGTGLGLAISKGLVRLMEGRMGVESEPGRGSTFWFTAVFEKGFAETSTKGEASLDVRGLRVLVVDDNATNRRVLERQLLSWYCRPDDAASASEALAKLHQAASEGDPFRIAVVDLEMPEMDGEALGRKIRQDPSFKDTRLVAMGAVGRRMDRDRLKTEGFAAHLSKPVKPSRFYDCLVTVAAGGEAESRPEGRRKKSVSTAMRKRNARILLAEDKATNRIVAVKVLEKLGYRVQAVANGLEVLRALHAAPYDLVLMDVQMPEMDGLEATRRIRDEKAGVNPSIPIVAMTAHALRGDREKCLEAGMDDYISKPIDRRELAGVLERYLGEEAGARPQTAGKRPVRGGGFDRAALLDRVAGDKELAERVVATFLEDVPHQVEALRSALERGDASEVQRRAYTLRSAAGNAGATVLQDVAHRLEAVAGSGRLDEAETLGGELEKAFSRFAEVAATPRETRVR